MITVSNRVDTNVPNGATHITLALDRSLAGQVERSASTGPETGDGCHRRLCGSIRRLLSRSRIDRNITEPANGDNVVAVGSYNTKAFNGSAVSQAISTFSSFGPTRDGRLKPDVAAPGEYLYSIRSPAAPASNYAGIVDNQYAIDREPAWPRPTRPVSLRSFGSPTRRSPAPRCGSGSGGRRIFPRRLHPSEHHVGVRETERLRAVQNTVASISAPARATLGLRSP